MSNLTDKEQASMSIELAMQLAEKPSTATGNQLFIAKEYLNDRWETLTEVQKTAQMILADHYDSSCNEEDY